MSVNNKFSEVAAPTMSLLEKASWVATAALPVELFWYMHASAKSFITPSAANSAEQVAALVASISTGVLIVSATRSFGRAVGTGILASVGLVVAGGYEFKAVVADGKKQLSMITPDTMPAAKPLCDSAFFSPKRLVANQYIHTEAGIKATRDFPEMSGNSLGAVQATCYGQEKCKLDYPVLIGDKRYILSCER